MTATVDSATPSPGVLGGLWNRQLDHYPPTRARLTYLAIVVLATIILYYELYIAGAVSPSIMSGLGMTFPFYVNITVIANAVGAFGSLLAGLADRWGRANLVAYGLIITGLLTLIGIPNASGKWEFGILFVVIGLVEGVILVATPALVRDFSPQLGRASAMGFWTLGPVVGSLVVAVVSTNTLGALHPWQDQFIICGIVGLVVGVIALVGLRELSPRLRDQLMVSLRDRALVEARAEGVDISDSLKNPWKQMLHLDVIGSALAISLFLLLYYTAVGFFTVYFTTIHGYTLQRANSIGNWFWAFDAGMLILTGIVSDRLRVRKPFMLVGGIGAIAMMIIFLETGATASYSSLVLVISLLACFMAIAYAPWMASFTETVEKRNPALTATGLAVWGWIIRVVIAVSIFILPFVVNSMTPLVQYGTQVSAISQKYAPELATLKVVDAKSLAALQANPADTAAATKAIGEIATAFKVSPTVATDRLKAVSTIPSSDLAYLSAHGPAVEAAAAKEPGQWQDWWWVCVAGMVIFLPFTLVMTGRWSPRKAKEDAEEHERLVQRELESFS